MNTKNVLDKATVIIGWILWAGIYVVVLGLVFMVIDTMHPFADWKPWTWSFWAWFLCIGGAVIGFIMYTLAMIGIIYLAKKYIHVGERENANTGLRQSPQA